MPRTPISDPTLATRPRFVRGHLLLIAIALWLLILLAGIGLKDLLTGRSYLLWAMLVASGLIGGIAGSFVFSKPENDRVPVAAILLLGLSSMGLYRLQHGDSGGLFTLLLLGSAGIGNLIASRVPLSVTQLATVDDADLKD